MIARLVAAGLLLAVGVAPLARSYGSSDRPVPRFVTLRADEANLRTGPGVRYPIDWVFVKSNLPLEVVAEYDTWRKVRDWEGAEGWVHQSLLSGQRGMVVVGSDVQLLRADPRPDATVVARAEPGVIGNLLRCPSPDSDDGAWCYVEVGGYRGWMPRASLWGTYPTEEVK